MIPINSLIPEGAILIHPKVTNKDELIRKLVNCLSSCEDLLNPNTLYKDVMAREALAPTLMGMGCAIPHAHSAAITKTHIALAILDKGLIFSEQEKDYVNIVFLLVGPPNNPSTHLKLLSKIARFLHDADFRTNLASVQSVDEVIRLLNSKEE